MTATCKLSHTRIIFAINLLTHTVISDPVFPLPQPRSQPVTITTSLCPWTETINFTKSMQISKQLPGTSTGSLLHQSPKNGIQSAKNIVEFPSRSYYWDGIWSGSRDWENRIQIKQSSCYNHFNKWKIIKSHGGKTVVASLMACYLGLSSPSPA